nr:MAG TPA: hypothetical protein [Caudoviricetes sp.]
MGHYLALGSVLRATIWPLESSLWAIIWPLELSILVGFAVFSVYCQIVIVVFSSASILL